MLKNVSHLCKSPARRHTRGQSLAEYGLILALVAIFCIAALQLLGTNMGDMFNKLAAAVANVAASMP